jgi:FAD/FMN-containing dehydrogenase
MVNDLGRETSLPASFTGDVLSSGDPEFDQARRVHNGLIDKQPSVIARCLTTPDVVDAVQVARAAGLEIAVRGGGHNVAGNAVTDGGMMIDLSRMRGVRVDPAGATIWAQGGVLWRELNRAAHVHRLATTGGVVSSTGIAGLTLGGGEGWLMGRFGMTVDNLLAVELVTADGEILAVDAGHHADLFWALRGGGGNFGVATAFEYRAHPVDTVLGGMVLHPVSRAVDAWAFYRQFSAEAPDELTVFFGLVHAPDGSGTKLAAMPLCHCGPDAAGAEADVAPLRRFGPPLLDLVERMPYPQINTLLDDGFPRGALNYWKSAFLRELSDDVIGVMVERFADCPSPLTAMVLNPFQGAVSRVPVDAMAMPHRQPGYSLAVLGQWMDPRDNDANVTWTRRTFEALRPHLAERSYVNDLAADDTDKVRWAYGPNWDRLVGIKRRYDPHNVFHLNQNIDPGSS